MINSAINFFILICICTSIDVMRIKKAKLYIGDNQSPESYIKIGNRLLSGEDGRKPDIPLAYEPFEKAAEQ